MVRECGSRPVEAGESPRASLTDTELREDDIEKILDADAARQGAEAVSGTTQGLGHEFGRQAGEGGIGD